MRQPGDDFRIDPFKVETPTAIPGANLDGALAAKYSQFQHNTLNTIMFKFCGNKCYNLGVGAVGDSEAVCMTQCTAKFGQAMSAFESEKQSLKATLADIKLTGGNVYEARDI